jgi:hypothetical protein
MPLAYKVVTEHEGLLNSWSTSGIHEVTYWPGEWVEKKNMFVVDSLTSAVRLISSANDQVWHVEVDELRPAPKQVPFDEIEFYDEFWSDPEWFIAHYTEEVLLRTPVGSMNCDRVKLIDRLR